MKLTRNVLKQAGIVAAIVLSIVFGSNRAQASQAINVGDGWHSTLMNETGGAFDLLGPFTFTATTNVVLKVADVALDYEQYSVLDFASVIGGTSVPARRGVSIDNPDSAYASAQWSHGTFLLGPGSHSIRLQLAQTGPGDSSGLANPYLRVDLPGAPIPPAPVQFSVGSNYTTGFNHSAMAVADFNKDGKLDLVTANRDTDDLSIMLGDGAGGFTLKTNIVIGTIPQGVAAADYDGDGIPDLIATRPFGNAAILLKGVGDGTFAGATFAPFNASSAGGAVLIADFNNDGKLDFTVALGVGFTTSLGNGAGTFSNAVPKFFSSDKAIAMGDFNNDGKLDLAEPVSSSKTVVVTLGNGDGTFGTTTNFTVPSSIVTAVSGVVTVGDLDKDGNLDLAVAQITTTNGLTILWGDGSGGFPTKTNYNLGISVSTIAIADVNGDKLPDLLLGSGGVHVMLGMGNRTFGPRVPFPVAGTTSIAVADFNRDGFPDVVAGDGYNTISVLLNQTFPPLQISKSGDNNILKWPTYAFGFQLQTTTNCADTNSWSAVAGNPAVVGTQNVLTNTTTENVRYYRLKR